MAQTMSIAQRLYESGLITYMRTDSVNLSDFALAASREEIQKLMGENMYIPVILQQRQKVLRRPMKPSDLLI